MDKRKEKTINTIYNAFANLMREKDYDDITIQDLLEEASISRWTLSWLKSQDSRFVDYWTMVASYTISPSVTFDSSYRSNVYYIKKKIIDPYS